MRKFAGVLLAAALMLPVGLMASPAGAAAAKPTCKTLSGNASFSPALPKIGSATKVKPTITVKGGKLGGCTGGGVSSAVVGATLKFGVANNCASLLAPGGTTSTTGTVSIVWNTKATSTAKVTLPGVKGKPTTFTLMGSITTGLFKGSKLSVVATFKPLNGGCTKGALTSVSFTNNSALTIK
jgi:hypothetical protein